MTPRQGSFQEQILPVETETERLTRLLRYEREAYQRGAKLVAGVDEAGRGCLAGPVVAAAVILPHDWRLEGVNDSKQLTAAQRERLFPLIQAQAVSVGVGVISADIIDNINILHATYRAMEEAIARLSPPPDYLLLDAVTLHNLPLPQKHIIRGDSLSISIAAASIIAKVTRDRLMEEFDAQFPQYGFARHKAYGTKQHRAAIAQFGPCPIHRLSFRGVKEFAR